MKLTDMAVSKAKARTVDYRMTDGKGLYLKVLKSGGKSWRYDFRLSFPDGTSKNSTLYIGLYPDISLAEARELHSDAHKLVSQGIDPHEHKKEKKRKQWQERELKFGDVANEWLEKQKNKDGELLSISTVRSTLNAVREFFEWLAIHPQYIKKVDGRAVQYLRLSDNANRAARASREKTPPTLEES